MPSLASVARLDSPFSGRRVSTAEQRVSGQCPECPNCHTHPHLPCSWASQGVDSSCGGGAKVLSERKGPSHVCDHQHGAARSCPGGGSVGGARSRGVLGEHAEGTRRR